MGWLPRGAVVKNLPVNAEDARDGGSIPGLERSPGVGNGNPLQYSCLENPMDYNPWGATVHRVTKSQTRLSTAQSSFYKKSYIQLWKILLQKGGPLPGPKIRLLSNTRQ